MKKIILTSVAVLAIGFANAQKGTILLAGNVAFASEKTADDKLSGFNFSPKVGYQFSDNLTVGVELGVGSATDKSGGVETKNNDFNAGAFLRYTKPLTGAFLIYADLGVGITSSKESTDVLNSVDQKTNGFYIGITPSVAIDLKKSFCLNFAIGGLGYTSSKPDFTGAEATNTFGLTFGNQINIGISKNF